MTKRLTLAAVLAATPALAVADADLGGSVPAVTASADTFDRFLGMGQNGRDLAQGVEHLHVRVQDLDRALKAADARFQAQGGADSVQKALLFNGREARDGLRQAYGILDDYSRKLGMAWRVEQEADGRLMTVFQKQADAVSRIKQAGAEAQRYADGIQSHAPQSQGGDPDAGQLSSIEPQEGELAAITEKVQLAKDALADLQDKLDGASSGLDQLKEKVMQHAQKAGMLDDGSGQALSMSVTGKASGTGSGSSREIISDALKTLDKAVALGKKTHGIMSALVARTNNGAELGRSAEQTIVQSRETASRALAQADQNHQTVTQYAAEYPNAQPPRQQELDQQTDALKAQTAAAAQQASAGGCASCGQAAAAKAAGSTCPCAKGKAEKALGDTQKLASLQRLQDLELQTPVQDGSAPARSSFGRVNTAAMRGVLGGTSFDGRSAPR